jgi:hypothetical protein
MTIPNRDLREKTLTRIFEPLPKFPLLKRLNVGYIRTAKKALDIVLEGSGG